MDQFNIQKINFEGRDSDNPFAFKCYDRDAQVGGKTMAEHLRFSVAYWHTYCGDGGDPFGSGTMRRPWDSITDPMDKAKARMEANFEVLNKLGIDYFCFHDRDIAPEGETLRQTNKQLDEIVDLAEKGMKDAGVKLLWGTANLFGNPRFVHGASTSPSADVYAYACAQVKKALEITHRLGGENYVFWGGREGYETLLNTDMKREQEHMARFLRMAVDYAREIGFTGQFLIEPKPKEPTKHQYDFDAAAVYGFLKAYDLADHFKLNIETNHATLAAHTVQHELRFAREKGMLGSIDANQGDLLLGWDTDQFPTDLYNGIFVMYEVLKNGGLAPGGLNFDAKLRRASYTPEDIFLGHIAGMDTFARALTIAERLLNDGKLDRFVSERYSGFDSGIGAEVESGRTDFTRLEQYVLDKTDLQDVLGRQEYLEGIVNAAIR